MDGDHVSPELSRGPSGVLVIQSCFPRQLVWTFRFRMTPPFFFLISDSSSGLLITHLLILVVPVSNSCLRTISESESVQYAVAVLDESWRVRVRARDQRSGAITEHSEHKL